MQKYLSVLLILVSLVLVGCTSSSVNPSTNSINSTVISQTGNVATIKQIKDIRVNSDADYAKVIQSGFEIKGYIDSEFNSAAQDPANEKKCVYICEPSSNLQYCAPMVTNLNMTGVEDDQMYPATQYHVFTGVIRKSPNPYGCIVAGRVEIDKMWSKDNGFYLEITGVSKGVSG